MWADVERFDIDDLIAADADPLRGRPRSFAVQVPELGPVGVHWHDYYELGYVLEGQAHHVVNGVSHSLSPGGAFLLSPADFHSLEPTGGRSIHLVNAVLHPRIVEPILESVVPSPDLDLPWVAPALQSTADDIRRIRAEASRRDPGWDLLVEASLCAVIVDLARSADDPARPHRDEPAGDSPPAAVQRALRFVERHFREPLSLAEVAAVAHLSPHWFSERFRRATGESFQSYLKRRRLQFARALLDSTELGVTEVCHAAGFNDVSYFGRAYRAQYGVPPSTGRRPSHPRTPRR